METYKPLGYHHIRKLSHQYGFDVRSPPTQNLLQLGYLFHEFGHACDYITRNEEWRISKLDFGFTFEARASQNSNKLITAGEIRAVAYAELMCRRFKPKHVDWDIGIIHSDIIAFTHMPSNPFKFSKRVLKFKTSSETKQNFEHAITRLQQIVAGTV